MDDVPRRATTESAWTWSQVLDRELDELAAGRKRRGGSTPDRGQLPRDLIGLALSGGGIRSATFSLGVLQAFARGNLLRSFDYLSTVSGGGYIGSWLTGWIRRDGLDQVERRLGGPRGAGGSEPGRPETAEPEPIRFLRGYSNYVTPMVGPFTGDTWAVVSVYVRNLLLNLLILIGVLGALLTLPRLVALSTSKVLALPAAWHSATACGAWIIAVLLFAASATGTQKSLNDFKRRQDCEAALWRMYGLTTAPFLLGALTLSIAVTMAPPVRLANLPPVAWWPLAGALTHGLVWAIARLFARPAVEPSGEKDVGGTKWLVLGILMCGAIGGLLLWLLVQPAGDLAARQSGPAILTIVGPPAIVLVCLIATTLHTGLLGRLLSDAQREWLGRQGGVYLRYMLLWLLFFSVAAFGPWLLRSLFRWTATGGLGRSLVGLGITAGWVGTTVVGVLIGRSRSTTGQPCERAGNPRQQPSSPALEVIGRVAPHIFAVGLLLLLATGVDTMWGALGGDPQPTGDYLSRFAIQPTWRVLMVIALSLVFLASLIARVDINEFSIHHLYRNRLIRCYLGASHLDRAPNPFTGFDGQDDLPLADLLPSRHLEGKKPGPLHIVNAALNLVGGSELAWQARRATSFAFTPVASGYEYVSHQGVRASKMDAAAYRPTERYAKVAGGVTLGTAMAISGAAASPNMGFHSSAPLAFLMTIFNVRLGWWAPNPRHPEEWTQGGPKFGLLYLLYELLGLSNDLRRNVYLSDGGHFENLGLYELVRRRCRVIVVSDASQDAPLRYADLTNAIQKCRVDFGVDIRFGEQDRPKRPDEIENAAIRSFARGTITYADGTSGVLFYLKPSLAKIDDFIHEDVRFYRNLHPLFPHESTADQWFDESQFECYRQLGATIGERHCDEIRAEVQKRADRPPAEPPGTRGGAAAPRPLGAAGDARRPPLQPAP